MIHAIIRGPKLATAEINDPPILELHVNPPAPRAGITEAGAIGVNGGGVSHEDQDS
jgi:hypothetical protein